MSLPTVLDKTRQCLEELKERHKTEFQTNWDSLLENESSLKKRVPSFKAYMWVLRSIWLQGKYGKILIILWAIFSFCLIFVWHDDVRSFFDWVQQHTDTFIKWLVSIWVSIFRDEKVAMGAFLFLASVSFIIYKFRKLKGINKYLTWYGRIQHYEHLSIAIVFLFMSLMLVNSLPSRRFTYAFLTIFFLLGILSFIRSKLEKKSPEIWTIFKEGEEMFKNGDYQKALNIFSICLSNKIKEFESTAYMGSCQMHMENFKEAISYFKAALSKSPNNEEITLELVWAYIFDNQYDIAYSELQRFLFIYPNSTNAQFSLGICQQEMGEHQEAIQTFTSLLDTFPEKEDLHNRIGLNLMLIGEKDEALSAYKKAIEMNPSFYVAYYNQAYIYAGDGRFNEALELLEQSLSINPIEISTLKLKTELLIEQNELLKAKTIVDTILNNYPNDDEALMYEEYLKTQVKINEQVESNM
ncbi:lipopolysaccharide assembly protein LapB [Brevibacillus sp. AF8]|uniref:tetratricopeptide repeat protein n=1 Tax=Brevibacillus sp. AF8 TaxID=2825881 RepID=UPI001E2C104C|nr:tetratricopeptide repeat protein [Brevibacillus sp. AF8]MCE0451555.1 tetratricopeptide repeat protein [Brevibacillus sp. AF8]